MKDTLISRITLDDIAEIIEQNSEKYGWKLLDNDEDGDDGDLEYLSWQICDDIVPLITVIDENDGGQAVIITLVLDDEEATLDDINHFNIAETLVSAYIDNENEDGTNYIILRSNLCSADGVTVNSLAAFLVRTYTGFINILEEDEDAPNDDND